MTWYRLQLWFLRRFQAYRDLELRHQQLVGAFGASDFFPPTLAGLMSALGVSARAVLPCFIRVEVVTRECADVNTGSVRIVIEERGPHG